MLNESLGVQFNIGTDTKLWCRVYVENFGNKYDVTINSRLTNPVTNQADLVLRVQGNAKPS